MYSRSVIDAKNIKFSQLNILFRTKLECSVSSILDKKNLSVAFFFKTLIFFLFPVNIEIELHMVERSSMIWRVKFLDFMKSG